jgi:hypothetical protein
MKTTLLISLFVIIAVAANADAGIGQNRKLTVPSLLQETDLSGITALAANAVRAHARASLEELKIDYEDF